MFTSNCLLEMKKHGLLDYPLNLLHIVAPVVEFVESFNPDYHGGPILPTHYLTRMDRVPESKHLELDLSKIDG